MCLIYSTSVGTHWQYLSLLLQSCFLLLQQMSVEWENRAKSKHCTQHCKNTDIQYIFMNTDDTENHFANGLTIFIQSWPSQRQTGHNTTWATEDWCLFLFARGKMGRWLKGSPLRPMLNDQMWTSGTERLKWAPTRFKQSCQCLHCIFIILTKHCQFNILPNLFNYS